MRKTLTLAFVLICKFSLAQVNQSCKVEFYLLKASANSNTSSKGEMKRFDATLSDLEDTAFIKDKEIVSYTISKDSLPSGTNVFEVSPGVAQRIKKLGLPLCCGKKFAVVANGQICYTGYFWNLISSFGCDWTTAEAFSDGILVFRKLPDYDFKPGDEDQRESKVLFDCLTSTKRLIRK